MENSRIKHGCCPLCGRTTSLTFHHLIPKKLHRRRFFRKHYPSAELNLGINICRACHNGIHDLYDEMSLAKRFRVIEKLKADEALTKHFEWVRRQKV